MGQLIFTFTLNSETQEAAIAGNIDISSALHVLQDLAIVAAVNKLTKEVGNGKDSTPDES